MPSFVSNSLLDIHENIAILNVPIKQCWRWWSWENYQCPNRIPCDLYLKEGIRACHDHESFSDELVCGRRDNFWFFDCRGTHNDPVNTRIWSVIDACSIMDATSNLINTLTSATTSRSIFMFSDGVENASSRFITCNFCTPWLIRRSTFLIGACTSSRMIVCHARAAAQISHASLTSKDTSSTSCRNW